MLGSNSSSDLPSVAVLLVCKNRVEKTIAALTHLRDTMTPSRYQVVLFDDASTDGTTEAARALLPDIHIVKGDGNAFWNGGLFQCWKWALRLEVDSFLWLNDDVLLDSDALQRIDEAYCEMRALTDSRSFILVGSTRDPSGGVSYGGKERSHSPFAFRLKTVLPGASLVPVDTFNGNIVLVPREVTEAIGLNDRVFHHNLGDIDYGLRAGRSGIPVVMMPSTLGVCEGNLAKRDKGFGSPFITIVEQWRKVNSHHGLPFKSWWRFTLRHSGPWFLLHFLIPYRRLLLPVLRRRW